ncbi:hypothetical protein HZC08_00335 [Candidatus Micrarchaeota archaeon]|nr:hypothetical protein [Candidatus Micrarchaeota archaeon]
MSTGAQAKQAWKGLERRSNSVFKFRDYPKVVEFVKRGIPTRTHLALLGGGKGHIATLLRVRGASYVSLELSPIEGAFVPVIVGDMETDLDREKLLAGTGNDRLYLANLFSLDYTDR